MDEKNFVTAGPAADRTAGSQCQSEVADRKTAHTPGPWMLAIGDLQVDSLNHCIADLSLSDLSASECRANAARIVACVNYCEGISNEQMAHPLALTLTAKENIALRVQRDELEAALRQLIAKAREATEADEPVDFAAIENATFALAKAGAA